MKIVVLFGGKSVEHEISIISAFQVIEALKTKYEVFPVYISKNNRFYYSKKIESIEDFKKFQFKKRHRVKFKNNDGEFCFYNKKKREFDLLFPIVHGKGVEDSTLISYFRFNGFDIVGDDISFYSSAQNKKMTKMILDGLGIKNIKYQSFKRGDNLFDLKLNFPLILKPNNLGSSLGIRLVKNRVEFEKGVSEIFKIDSEVLAEEYLQGSREFNVSFLINDGEVENSDVEEVEKETIYTFSDKYLSGNKKKGMNYNIRHTFEVDEKIKSKVIDIGKKIYKEFNASGVIRIDFLYKDELYVNEINAIPGSYSYYLWGKKYDFLELLDIVIKESKRYLFFNNKKNHLIYKDTIFTGLNKY